MNFIHTATIIDEFHDNAIKAVQKYQGFHSIDFLVAAMSVSGDKVALSYVGNTTVKGWLHS
jgi:hypothetical protein